MITKVKFWTIRKRVRANRPTRFEVRWTVDNRPFSRTFPVKAQAEAFRTDLQIRVRNGEVFDTATGLPTSQRSITCFELAQQMTIEKWSHTAAKSRQTEIDNLAYLLCALVPVSRQVPDGLRLVLRSFLGRQSPSLTPSQKSKLNWLTRASIPVTSVDVATVKRVLQQLSVRSDGTSYSASVLRQRRIYLSSLMTYAVEQQHLSTNPVKSVKLRHANQTPQLPVRNVSDFATAQKVINDVADTGIRTYLATLLYAGLRPSEAAGLRVEDCKLSETGWGTLTLSRSASRSASSWTDSGDTRDARGLKHRSAGTVRVVPIPPVLVDQLRELIGDKDEGYVFLNRKGKIYADTTIARQWNRARHMHSLSSTELKRPYDLRHLAASTWITAGLPITEVAARLGHSPEVCLRVYAHTIDSHRDYYNELIDSQLP